MDNPQEGKEQIVKTEYYLTPPFTNPNNIGDIVKLGVKVTLIDGKKYGNVITIPLEELKNLIKNVEITEVVQNG